MATGHYARLQPCPGGGPPQLLRGADLHKDQTYFLASVQPAALRHVMFPVGHLKVRGGGAGRGRGVEGRGVGCVWVSGGLAIVWGFVGPLSTRWLWRSPPWTLPLAHPACWPDRRRPGILPRFPPCCIAGRSPRCGSWRPRPAWPPQTSAAPPASALLVGAGKLPPGRLVRRALAARVASRFIACAWPASLSACLPACLSLVVRISMRFGSVRCACCQTFFHHQPI